MPHAQCERAGEWKREYGARRETGFYYDALAAVSEFRAPVDAELDIQIADSPKK